MSFARPPVVTVRPSVRPACPVLGSSCRLSPDMRLIDHCELPNGPSLHSVVIACCFGSKRAKIMPGKKC